VARWRLQRGTGRGNRSTGERLSRPLEGAQASAAGLASPLPALRLRHGTRARGESTPDRHSKSTRQPFTVRVKCHSRTLAQAPVLPARTALAPVVRIRRRRRSLSPRSRCVRTPAELSVQTLTPDRALRAPTSFTRRDCRVIARAAAPLALDEHSGRIRRALERSHC